LDLGIWTDPKGSVGMYHQRNGASTRAQPPVVSTWSVRFAGGESRRPWQAW